MKHLPLILLGVLALLPSCIESAHAQEAEAPTTGEGESAGVEGTGELELAENAEAVLRLVTTREMEEAVRNGLKGLSELQLEDGSYEGSYKTAVTSLCGLAFLASGSLPGSGPYSKHITKAVDWLLETQDPNTGYITSDSDGSRIHGHGYAVLFLSQVYGHQDSQSSDLRKKLTKAIKCLETGQTKEGGWGYVPDDDTWDEGSTTVCVMQGLRAAQDAGIGVKNETIAKAIGYMEKIAEPKTFKDKETEELKQAYTFMYSLSSGRSSDSYALAAAACASINNIGVYSKVARWNEKNIGSILHGGMRWLMNCWKTQYFSDNNLAPTSYHYFYYANQYACQAAWQFEDLSYFKYYFPRMRDVLVAEQARNGGRLWPHSNYGTAYATAFALLILQVPYQYLPAFQR